MGSLNRVLTRLLHQENLDREESRQLLTLITTDHVPDTQIAAFLMAIQMRQVTVEELSGFRDALLDLRVKVDLDGMPAIDLCGTGGDGKHTFNISTLAAFIVAGAGEKVVKHGNVGVSSASGSSNVMESLGYSFTNDPDLCRKQLDAANITYFHAPLFHPAMKRVGPIRKEMGIKTFFNLLGPLLNPADPSHQLVGVFDEKTGHLYNEVFKTTGKAYTIVYSTDGYDEISLTGPFLKMTKEGTETLEPADIGMAKLSPEDLSTGPSTEDAVSTFNMILDGKGTHGQNQVVIANAAMALNVLHPDWTITTCVEKSTESLKSGQAKKSLLTLLDTQS